MLQTLGFTGPRVFLLTVGERLILSLLGGVLGIGGAMLALT